METLNRKTHRFNNAWIGLARPLALGYVRGCRARCAWRQQFLQNLATITTLNSLLQGKPQQAPSRWAVSAQFDRRHRRHLRPGRDAKLPRKSEDFGQTLGVWGWSGAVRGTALFGTRTVRDVFGLVGDAPLSPTRQIDSDKLRLGLQGLQLVDVRTQLLSIDALREGAVDEYALFRDSWLQRRNYQISSDRKRSDDENLPEYLLEEEENPTVPIDAMPPILPSGG